ncbi:hypothetical protein NSQ62_09325 [Solibacillus sp. FSL H8-0523]|uniref:hypothetical protein n=1 Tax=Solibacillus sp. FSL H8-0523 TaxID=2954511 RepID=UPI0031015EF1
MPTKDLRMQEPLFNSAFFVLLIGEAIGIAYVLKYFDPDVQNRVILGLEKLNLMPYIFSVICLIALITLCGIYVLKVRKHNLANPTKKLKPFTAFTLNEFNDDDEFFSKVTNEATRKGYIFLTNAIGVLILLLVLQLPHIVYIVLGLSICIMQNLLYYTHMKKYYQ